MFEEMRQAINLPPSEDILDFIYAMPEQDQVVAFAKIQDIERRAMASQVPSVGLVRLLSFLDEKGLGKGICTRNFEWVVFSYSIILLELEMGWLCMRST